MAIFECRGCVKFCVKQLRDQHVQGLVEKERQREVTQRPQRQSTNEKQTVTGSKAQSRLGPCKYWANLKAKFAFRDTTTWPFVFND